MKFYFGIIFFIFISPSTAQINPPPVVDADRLLEMKIPPQQGSDNITLKRASCIYLGSEKKLTEIVCTAKGSDERSLVINITSTLFDIDITKEENESIKHLKRTCVGIVNFNRPQCFFRLTAEMRREGSLSYETGVEIFSGKQIIAGRARLLRLEPGRKRS